jgi:hypothetical protein
MMALGMRRAMPQMTRLLAQTNTQSQPIVICAYGEEASLREVSQSGGADAAMMMIIGAIAIPT